MTKVLIRVKNCNSKTFETKGILDRKRNILTYIDADGIRNVLNLKDEILTRQSNEMKIILNFSSKVNPYIQIYDENIKQEITIPIKLIKIKNEVKFLSIIYFVDDIEKIEYEIEIVKFY